VIELIRPYFEHWGYLIVFGICLLENSAFVGAVIPGDVVLLLAGFYVQRSSLNLAPVIFLAINVASSVASGSACFRRSGSR
jgi:membrane protein DedA with SNARE-associated domain